MRKQNRIRPNLCSNRYIPMENRILHRVHIQNLYRQSLNYKDTFKDIFDKYLNYYEMKNVKTTNMGSMFELQYLMTLSVVHCSLFRSWHRKTFP